MALDIRQHMARAGEELAHEHLQRLGFRAIARNYRTRFGELDLIVCDDERIVFVEVKTRRAPSRAGSAIEAISPEKARRVRAMASAWLAETPDRPRAGELRFDAIGVTVDRDGRLVRLDHVEAAF